MKKFSKILMTTAGLALIGTTLAGCGEKADDGKIHIVFGHCAGDTIQQGLEHYAAEFAKLVKENENVDVQVDLMYVGGYKEVANKVGTWFLDGEAPNIFVAYPDAVSTLIARNDIGTQNIINFDKFINDPTLTFGTDRYLGDRNGISDFIESFINEGKGFTVDGTYAMPLMKSTETMLYNLDLVEKAMGFIHPEIVEQGKVEQTIAAYTWDEFIEFCRAAMERKNEINTNLKYAFAYDSDSNMIITHINQNRIPYSGIKNNKGYIGFNDKSDGEESNYKKVYSLLEEYVELHDDKILTTKGAEGTYSSNSFKDSEIMFVIGSSGGTGYSFPAKGSFDVGMAKVPAKNNNEIYVSQGVSVGMIKNPKKSAEENDLISKYAWKFYKYLTSPVPNVDLCVNYSMGYTPVRYSCYTTDEYIDTMSVGDDFAKAAKVVTQDVNGRYFNTAVFPGSAQLRDQIGGAVSSLLKGSIVADTGKTLIETALDKAIENAGTFIV